jgi:hypothetical protein
MSGTYWCMYIDPDNEFLHPLVGFPTVQHLFSQHRLSCVCLCGVTGKLQDRPHTIGTLTLVGSCTVTWSLSALIQLPRRMQVAGVLRYRAFVIYWLSTYRRDVYRP